MQAPQERVELGSFRMHSTNRQTACALDTTKGTISPSHRYRVDPTKIPIPESMVHLGGSDTRPPCGTPPPERCRWLDRATLPNISGGTPPSYGMHPARSDCSETDLFVSSVRLSSLLLRMIANFSRALYKVMRAIRYAKDSIDTSRASSKELAAILGNAWKDRHVSDR